MSDTDRVAVEYRVVRLERVLDHKKLVASADVTVTVAGIEFAFAGLMVMRMPNGMLQVRNPHWRHPTTGVWHPSIAAPPEITDAVAAEILDRLEQAA